MSGRERNRTGRTVAFTPGAVRAIPATGQPLRVGQNRDEWVNRGTSVINPTH